ncbi:MAG: DNA primase [Ottowia sp.]|nr:DNA primase [Ottowia sp.]
MIPQSFIQDLLSRVDIVDVIGRYVQLKKGGANLLGLCPFHSEKSPSFTVSPTKQFFHCFGCGAHGSAIGFLMEHAGVSYVEAIRDLAQEIGMVVPEETASLAQHARAQAVEVQSLSGVMGRACDYYRKQLRITADAVSYLKGRGLSGEVAAKFALGYAPDGWQNLAGEFGAYRDAEMVKPLLDAGLLLESQRTGGEGHARYYDRFRARIIFPIRNIKGQVIGFGGRVLDRGEPKYLNSPETALFSKGHELYGLFEARTAIREKGYVFVTEGYMDVVALVQLGFANTVATLGTACTPFHIQKLLRQTDCIIFAFDGDTAGRRAARKALEVCLPYVADNKVVRFLFLPSEHDPDSFVREKGVDAFVAEVENAMPLSQFLLNSVTQNIDLRQPEGRAQAQFAAKPLLQAMLPGGLRLQILRGLAELTASTVMDIEAVCDLKSMVKRRAAPSARTKRAPPAGLEQQVLRLLLRFPQLANDLDAPARMMLTQEGGVAYGDLFADLLRHCDAHPSNFAALSEYLAQSHFAQTYAELQCEIMADEMTLEAAQPELGGAITKLRVVSLKREQRVLVERIQSGQAGEDEHMRYRELMSQIHKD